MDFERAVSQRVRRWMPTQDGKTVRTGGMNELVSQAKRVIKLGQGDVGFVTPAHVREAAKRALDEGHTGYEYLRELRVAVADKLLTDNGIEADPDREIILSDGCHAVLFQIFNTLVGPGDEVILSTPGAYYEKNTLFVGGSPVEIGLRQIDGFRVDPDAIAAAITPRTKIIGLTSPGAPFGTVIPRTDLERIAALAIEHDLLVISDEIYEKINHGQVPHTSIASLPGMRERTITVNGFSKGYAMTGWRVGYAALPAYLMPAVAQVNALNTIWLNTPAQYAALAALRGPQEPFEANQREYTRKMRLLVEGLNAIRGIECRMPDGTYYCFPSIHSLGVASADFTRYLFLTEGVLVQAGTIFGKGGEGHIRASCAEPEDELQAGLAGLARAVERLRREGPEALKLEKAPV
jgi:aspartate/methionine/tyrosine aminotransferase